MGCIRSKTEKIIHQVNENLNVVYPKSTIDKSDHDAPPDLAKIEASKNELGMKRMFLYRK